jgi:hypothetical protein
MKLWKIFVRIISAEWVLDKRDNGGAAIALRSIFFSLTLFAIALALIKWIDPERTSQFSLSELRTQIVGKMAWLGAIFAASYAALYTRFSSQWSYLANLYNDIEQACAADAVNIEVIAEWKAGFIEDAEYLHLAHKENFATIIHVWGKDNGVKRKYIEYTPGGQKRYDNLMKSFSVVYAKICARYSNV